MKCLIRRAIVTDAAGACDVVRRSISELCVEDHQGDQTTIDAWIANQTVPNFESWIRSNSTIALVAEGARCARTARAAHDPAAGVAATVP